MDVKVSQKLAKGKTVDVAPRRKSAKRENGGCIILPEVGKRARPVVGMR